MVTLVSIGHSRKRAEEEPALGQSLGHGLRAIHASDGIEELLPPVVNRALKDSDNERARALTELDRKFVVDVAQMTPKASAYFRRRFAPIFDRFDHLILSHEVGHMKPDRRFYDACVRAAGVPAGSCAFIDDLPENVAGARRAGLAALHYVDTPSLIADLRGLGVEVPPGEG